MVFGLDDAAFGAATALVTTLVDRIFPDKVAQAAERADFLLKAQTLDNQLAAGQMAIDQAEASNSSLFVSGWRPCVGWCCAAAFSYHLILQPLLTYCMAIFGHTFSLPTFDSNLLSTTLYGMLGLGVMRTYEKVSDKGQLPWTK